MITPAIIGVIGIVTKCLKQNSEAIPVKHSIDSLQQTAILWNIAHNMESASV
jgi:hypothetical protein